MEAVIAEKNEAIREVESVRAAMKEGEGQLQGVEEESPSWLDEDCDKMMELAVRKLHSVSKQLARKVCNLTYCRGKYV